MVKKVYKIDSPVWKPIWVLPALITFLALISTGNFSDDRIKSAPFLIIRCSLLLIMALIYSLLVDSLEAFQKQTQMKAEKEQLNRVIKIEKEHYAILKDKINENRRFRHDIRHQLAVLQHYEAENQTDKILDYLNKIIGEIPASNSVLCANEAVNAISLYYQNQAETAGIRDCSLLLAELPDDLGASKYDICILVGNLLDNGVRAAKDSDRSFLHLVCHYKDSFLSVSIENSYREFRPLPDGTFETTRKNGGGIDLRSIQSITGKCHGGCRFTAENYIFRSLAYLNLSSCLPE